MENGRRCRSVFVRKTRKLKFISNDFGIFVLKLRNDVNHFECIRATPLKQQKIFFCFTTIHKKLSLDRRWVFNASKIMRLKIRATRHWRFIVKMMELGHPSLIVVWLWTRLVIIQNFIYRRDRELLEWISNFQKTIGNTIGSVWKIKWVWSHHLFKSFVPWEHHHFLCIN